MNDYMIVLGRSSYGAGKYVRAETPEKAAQQLRTYLNYADSDDETIFIWAKKQEPDDHGIMRDVGRGWKFKINDERLK